MWASRAVVYTSAALLLGALPLAAAHGDEMDVGTASMTSGNNAPADATSTIPAWPDFAPSYFRHPAYQGWMLAHIAFIVLAWFFVMPVAIMLSMARSRFHLPAQLVFHILNGLAVFGGFVYNRSTPDLYVVNAHHTIGWIVTSVTVVWTLLSVCSAFDQTRRKRTSPLACRPPLSTGIMSRREQQRRYADNLSSPLDRFSQDSGNYSEGRTNSSESVTKKQERLPMSPAVDDSVGEHGDYDLDEEKYGFLHNAKVNRFFSHSSEHFPGRRFSSVVCFSQIVLEKFLLLLGFLAITTGFVTYGGIFRGGEVLSGLAHYIKGAIFFWYGLLTLGRWMGAFTDFGWAWNVRPPYPIVSRWKSIVPSAEFTESFVIWLYGASNVFLEHLNNWGGEWSPQDFEHVSITVLFFGGGLFGMLLESGWARKLLRTTVELQRSKDLDGNSTAVLSRSPAAAEAEAAFEPAGLWAPSKAEKTSLNPMPALVIMLLGMMMSSHHQQSMVSAMMHKQWGSLFSGFAIARLITYVSCSIYSHQRGVLFMNSAADSVRSIETNGLDAMTIFTITMGLTGIIMAWEMVCLAVKGWAQRREQPAAGNPLS